jgi:hypothetical protein
VVEQVAAPVVGVLGDVVEQVAAPVVGVLGDVVEQVAAPVVEALDPVLDQVLAPVADIVGGSLASLLGLGTGGGAPIILTSVVAASGSIDFEGGAPTALSLPVDDLFSRGGYTDYNLVLHGDIPAGAGSAPGTALQDAADSVGDDILGALLTPPDSGNGGHGSSHHVGLPSLLGDFGLHGLGL